MPAASFLSQEMVQRISPTKENKRRKREQSGSSDQENDRQETGSLESLMVSPTASPDPGHRRGCAWTRL